MKKIDFYEEILGKYRCHYNFNHSKPFNIQCYAEKDSDNIIYRLIGSLNVSIDVYLALMTYEIEAHEVHTSIVDRDDYSKTFLNSLEFLDLQKPVKIKFIFSDYNDETSYNAKLEDLITSLVEYKNKYSMFSNLEIYHDYHNDVYKSFLKGYFHESSEMVSSRATIIEKYLALTVELEKEMAITDKKKEDERRNKYLKLKKEFENTDS